MEEKLKNRRLLRPLLRKSIDAFENLLFKRAHCIVCSSSRQAAEVGRRVRHTDAKVYQMCNGVDPDEFTAVADKKGSSRIFFNASVPYYQNVAALRNLLSIFDHFEQQGFDDYSAIIVVNDETKLSTDLAEAIGSNPRVRLLSNQKSLVPWLHECDFVLLPYEAGHLTTAGPRLKVFEALACGKIVLSTREGLDEIVGCVDGRHVVVCSDWLDMAGKTMALIKEGDSVRKRAMREEARRFVEAEYSWDSLVDTYGRLER